MDSAITAELERITLEHDGLLHPEHVVSEASAPESPLHGYFEWDDTEAARCYRLRQAGDLIRVAVKVIETPTKEPVRVRAFCSLPEDRHADGGFRMVLSVMSDAEQRKQLFALALREMESFERKYKHLEELRVVLEAMRKVAASAARQHEAVA